MFNIFSYRNTDKYIVFKPLLLSYLKSTLLGSVYKSSFYTAKLHFLKNLLTEEPTVYNRIKWFRQIHLHKF